MFLCRKSSQVEDTARGRIRQLSFFQGALSHCCFCPRQPHGKNFHLGICPKQRFQALKESTVGSSGQWEDAAKFMCIGPALPSPEGTLLGVSLQSAGGGRGNPPRDILNETLECQTQCKLKAKGLDPRALNQLHLIASFLHSLTCIKTSPRLVSRSIRKTIECHLRSPHSPRILMEQPHSDHTQGQHSERVESTDGCPLVLVGACNLTVFPYNATFISHRPGRCSKKFQREPFPSHTHTPARVQLPQPR